MGSKSSPKNVLFSKIYYFNGKSNLYFEGVNNEENHQTIGIN